MARKWIEGAAGLLREAVTKPFAKMTGKRADELISVSLTKMKKKKLQPVRRKQNLVSVCVIS
ncbi:MAG: hypothetical protein IJ522_03170 [Acidaminococcaceae bacterium]|nr:hypothetical protein [Acidaminococcaceae bacterium]